MLYIKKYSGFIISIVIGLLLYEEANYAYTYRTATAYSDHMIYRLILSMGSGSSGWNGILFPILAALPMGISYVREYRSGYLKLRLQKMSRKRYVAVTLIQNSILGGLGLLIPYVVYCLHLYFEYGTKAYLNISFKDSFIGRKSWIAHLMVTDVKTYSFYIVYWSVSIAFVIMVIFYRAVILNFFKRLIAICVKSYYGLTFMAAVVIWSIYGFVSKQYMSGITDYFAGFKKLDIFLLLYLFYQMPIWILLYYFLTKNFSFYYIQFALRKGNTISWMKHLAIIFLVCTYLYYGVGMIVIAFISGTVINVNLIMEMSNMILQTIALLLLVFLCWLHEAGDKHMGFIKINCCRTYKKVQTAALFKRIYNKF